MDQDEVPDMVVEGDYVCPWCGAHFSPPEWPAASLMVRCCKLLVELTRVEERGSTY